MKLLNAKKLTHSLGYFIAIAVYFLSINLSSQTHQCAEKKTFGNKKTRNPPLYPSNLSDSIHVKHYSISIDTINYSAKTLRANTSLIIQSKQYALGNITLWLLQLQVDSVKSGVQLLSFSYNDTLIRITPALPLNINDTVEITVYYQGAPKGDASGWGGWYFNGNYAFNLGVGFDADPHNFGRVWFPCIDEFTDKSTYDFFIRTPINYKAFCNGILQSETVNPDSSKTWHWKMNHPIPTYLASLAVAPFYTIYRNFSGIPAELGVLAADSIKTLNTYANLDTCLSTFINAWGPYPFEKVGFVMTPVTYGGMEHASSIHLSKVFVDGSKNYETLWAHELSHMWWGDNITCDKAEEMWLNEGWATFNEHLFTEAVYGEDAYKNSFRKDHREVLQFAHIEDGNYWAMNNLPHAYTYASLSVYTKGALVAHTLRKFMGDSLFFEGCKNFIDSFSYSNANSTDLRNVLSSSSGLNLDDFFEGWVFTPGFPQFSIDSFKSVQNGGNFDINLFTKQKQKGNNLIYGMNVEFNFTDGLNDTDIVLTLDNSVNSFTISLPFDPLWISVDRNEKMMDAVTDYENTISSIGNKTFPETNVSFNVQDTGSGKSIVRIEHNFVAPDPIKNNASSVRLSNYHYWKVDGIFSNGFRSKTTFTYDGSTSGTTGYLDNSLITTTEDSLIILFREGAWDDWKKVNGYTHNKGILTDRKGNFVLDTIRKGEYVFGMYDYTVSGKFPKIIEKPGVSIIPNPVSGLCRIEFVNLHPSVPLTFEIRDIRGKGIYSGTVYSHQPFIVWDSFGVSPGVYSLSILENGNILENQTFIIAD